MINLISDQYRISLVFLYRYTSSIDCCYSFVTVSCSYDVHTVYVVYLECTPQDIQYCLLFIKEFYHPPDGLKASEVRESMRYGSSDEDDDDETRVYDEQVC